MIEKLEHYGINPETGHVVEPVERMMFDKIKELIDAVNRLEESAVQINTEANQSQCAICNKPASLHLTSGASTSAGNHNFVN